ncbi:hypothetical protein CK203_111018 [Vitis vinifera]|uniref:Uncharacterized protein n=1 Tax=Vitis vinifera TaxID=29760 RepID=A0A438D2N5_VITVI|nr:hypothetical protein CK203_111018 [Vitis vinifera]
MEGKEKPLPLANDEEEKNEESPTLNLKPLPNDLKYAYLEEDKYLVVIYSKLSYQQETSLLEVLRKCKEAIGWSIYDLKGISPLIEIALEDKRRHLLSLLVPMHRRMPFGLCMLRHFSKMHAKYL